MDRFIFTQNLNLPKRGLVTWRAPSNIALIKYWGKKGLQLPQNPSLSFTLKNCHTTTTLSFDRSNTHSVDVYLDGQVNDAFKPKIEQFFERIMPYCPYVNDYAFKVETSNSFPHSSGIASSASGMAALALCIADMEDANKQKASFLARLGSGSACRSIDSGLVAWGAHDDIVDSSDLYAIPYPNPIHMVFENFQDTILLIDRTEKKVSSSLGHGLMKNHPFATARFNQAYDHIDQLQTILASGDIMAFIDIIEAEALTLHAMMMTSQPSFVLMKPNTLNVIEEIRAFRRQTNVPVCFTLDAGANIHCLYPASYKIQVQDFIDQHLIAYCQDGGYIHDEIGTGAIKIK